MSEAQHDEHGEHDEHDEHDQQVQSDGHQHGMNIPEDWTGPFDQAFWDARYAEKQQIWSGNPNPHLVRVAQPLDPGRALDIGSGEGSDAVWLARQGWTVTATDLSVVALDRGAEAIAGEAETARRIAWEQHDVLTWQPPASRFDLVSSQYSHFPTAQMNALFERLASAVAPGGILHIVGHEAHDHSPMGPEYFFEAAALASLLSPASWTVLEAGLLPHPTREGSDEVLTALRL